MPAEELEKNTFIAYPDMDASPTKAWLILHGNDPQWKSYFDRAFGKRPAEELYDLRTRLSDLRGSLQGNDKLDEALFEAVSNTEKREKLRSEFGTGKNGGGE